jgi:putative colanic acid biosynthesis UDP-glucose lipid carrier transferase
MSLVSILPLVTIGRLVSAVTTRVPLDVFYVFIKAGCRCRTSHVAHTSRAVMENRLPMQPSSRRILQQSYLRDAVLRMIDAFCILAGLAIARALGTGEVGGGLLLVGTAAIAVYFVVAEFSGMYRSWRGVASQREVVCVLVTWTLTLLALLALGYATRHADTTPRSLVMGWLFITPLLIAAGRMLVRGVQRVLRAKGFNTRGFAIVGVNELGIQLARNIEDAPEMGLKLAGFYDDRPAERTADLPADVGHCVGDIDELVARARGGQVDMIFITLPMRAEDRIRGVLQKLGDSTASVYIVPDFFVFELLHSRWTNIGGLPAVSIFENPFYGVDGLLKRTVDLVLAGVLLVLLTLPLLAIAALVKLTSRGPVFFRQKRYGLDGREILVWKFRSMRVMEDGAKVVQATKGDSRVTPIGAILRRTSLDELPQLFNVIDGSMSLVGPRPHASAHNEQYRGLIQGYMLRHKVKPGITGLAQVSGWRGETDTLEKMAGRVECDHRYIREWSLWLDIQILFKTIFVVLSRQNAY